MIPIPLMSKLLVDLPRTEAVVAEARRVLGSSFLDAVAFAKGDHVKIYVKASIRGLLYARSAVLAGDRLDDPSAIGTAVEGIWAEALASLGQIVASTEDGSRTWKVDVPLTRRIATACVLRFRDDYIQAVAYDEGPLVQFELTVATPDGVGRMGHMVTRVALASAAFCMIDYVVESFAAQTGREPGQVPFHLPAVGPCPGLG